MIQTYCTIPISTLIVAPFSLAWGVSVYATVTAVNVYGSSTVSSSGNGAIILTVPSAPVSLANNPSITSGSQIGLTWAQGPSNGGTPVIDFTISYMYGANAYTVLASAITSQSYTAVGLSPGIQYTFEVRARNAYGSSSYSTPLSVLSA